MWDNPGAGKVIVSSTTINGCSGVSELIVNINPTGLSDKQHNSINYYPNPFTKKLTIQYPNPSHENYQLSIIDLSGKLVRLIPEITEEEITIERENLKNGLYIIELKGDKIFREIIIVQ